MKFSIIIPSHNGEGHIEKCLQSVAEQRFIDYELIVVCDACEDNTAMIAAKYGAKVISVDAHRCGLSRNAGLDAAQGEWVLFMDDDDWLLHEYVLDMLASVVGKSGEDVLFFSFIWKGVGYIQQTENRHYVAVWNKAWKRSLIGDTRFEDVEYAEDVPWHAQIMAKKPVCAFWNMPMYYYNYMRTGSLSDRHERGEI